MTIYLDATGIEVFGGRKQSAARNRQGQMSYAPHVAFWAQRGRALTSELVGGNGETLSGVECTDQSRTRRPSHPDPLAQRPPAPVPLPTPMKPQQVFFTDNRG